MELKEKTVVVTGGGNGIGRALSIAFAQRGAQVVVADIEDAAADAVVAEIGSSGGAAIAQRVDVTDEASVQNLRDAAIGAYGTVQILVNNAGVLQPTGPLHATSQSDFQWLFNVNVGGVMNGIRSFAPHFIEQEIPTQILNTASEHSFGVPHLGGGLYTATKHAVIGLSDVLRRELPEKVSVSVLCPGIVGTTLWKASERRQEAYGGGTQAPEQAGAMMQHIGMPADDVAERALVGLEANEFLIVTHPHAVEIARARWTEVESAFEAQAPRFDGDEKYDLNLLMQQANANN